MSELKSINGVLLLDKPCQLTSNSALQKVKRLFHAKKAGHTGSLDPLATGMLPICFGEATKYCQFLLEADKCYQVKGKLGVKTTTGDSEGEVLETADVTDAIDKATLIDTISSFKGDIWQLPPMYSALKKNGVPLYKLARKGIEVERKKRQVRIYDISLTAFDWPYFSMTVRCSKGTYIRTLVEDIGDVLGLGAHVVELHRLYSEPYQGAMMQSLTSLQAMVDNNHYQALNDLLLPVESMLSHLPTLTLAKESLKEVRHGRTVRLNGTDAKTEGPFIRLFDSVDAFIGVGEVIEGSLLKAKRLQQNAVKR